VVRWGGRKDTAGGRCDHGQSHLPTMQPHAEGAAVRRPGGRPLPRLLPGLPGRGGGPALPVPAPSSKACGPGGGSPPAAARPPADGPAPLPVLRLGRRVARRPDGGHARLPRLRQEDLVYAVLHGCIYCGRPLESPSRSAGAETTCPACKHPLLVPKDVRRTEVPAWSDDRWFGCYCLACSGEVVAREKDVGAYAVCPHCQATFVVPHGGHSVQGGGPASPTRHALDALHAAKEVACPSCQARFSATASVCPACGASTPTPSGW
jgi:DNA-directed RNA polymerase subunit RPC12/RpoP